MTLLNVVSNILEIFLRLLTTIGRSSSDSEACESITRINVNDQIRLHVGLLSLSVNC